jgi:hypothetical protein
MRDILEIRVKKDNADIISCGYVHMEPYAPSTGRKFHFKNLYFSAGDIDYTDVVSVSVNFFDSNNICEQLLRFDLVVINFSDTNESHSNMWIYGNVINLGTAEYRQGIVDVFYSWSTGDEINWFDLPVNSHMKLDYISACMYYSSFEKRILEKEYYRFDMSMVQEERDFIYISSLELLGERSYLGHDLHTYKDCIYTLCSDMCSFEDKTIIFDNSNAIGSLLDLDFLDQLNELFLSVGFKVWIQ